MEMPANLRSPTCEGIPLAVFFFACNTMQSRTLISVPEVPAFIAIIFLCVQHSLQIYSFGYSSITLGTSVPNTTVLLQSSDPAGTYCGRFTGFTESNSVSHNLIHMPDFSHAGLEKEAEQPGRSFFYAGKSYIPCFVLFTLFCSPACLE